MEYGSFKMVLKISTKGLEESFYSVTQLHCYSNRYQCILCNILTTKYLTMSRVKNESYGRICTSGNLITKRCKSQNV